MRIALVTEVFFGDGAAERLGAVLAQAAARGADVAVLPELPLNGWAPSSKTARDEDAEAPGGPRTKTMRDAAARAGLALLGGVIERDPTTGRRHNTALLFTADGSVAARYRKVHLPEEEGYWETSHYEPGDAPPDVVSALQMPIGLQICSDVNRPFGFQLLAARGAAVVFAPRATPPETYERWRLVLRANAVTSATYVVSPNRPRSENGASIGGPSVAIDPHGAMLLETGDPLAVFDARESVVAEARAEYPGYLHRFPELYARGWSETSG